MFHMPCPYFINISGLTTNVSHAVPLLYKYFGFENQCFSNLLGHGIIDISGLTTNVSQTC